MDAENKVKINEFKTMLQNDFFNKAQLTTI